METKYGKKTAHVKVQVLACLGPMVIGAILLAAAIIVLFNCLSGGFSSGFASRSRRESLTPSAITACVGCHGSVSYFR